jgi:Sec-independent protein translocase protein TatA
MMTNVQFLGMGRHEAVVVLVSALILFLAGRIPDFARGLSRAFDEFRKAVKEIDRGGFDAGQSLGGIHGKTAAEALTIDNQTIELYDPIDLRHTSQTGDNNGRVTGKINKKQKSILIVASIMLLICAVSNLSKPGSFSKNLAWTLIYCGETTVVFAGLLVLVRDSKKKA